VTSRISDINGRSIINTVKIKMEMKQKSRNAEKSNAGE
jgi:hypothetical protein